MSSCGNCGADSEPGFRICPECGAPVQARPSGQSHTRTIAATTNRRGQRKLGYIVIQNGSSSGQSTMLTTSTDIGREQDNQVVIDDPHVSAHHGRVRLEDGSFVYHDLASSGGSWHLQANGGRKRIDQPLRLMHGDAILIGRTRLVFMESTR